MRLEEQNSILIFVITIKENNMNIRVGIVELHDPQEDEQGCYKVMMFDEKDHDFIALDCDTPHHMTHTHFLCSVKIVADTLQRSVPELGEYVIYETYKGFHVLYENILHVSQRCDVITSLRYIIDVYRNILDIGYLQNQAQYMEDYL